MKIRQGLVSNSSSSSFIVFMTEDCYEKILAQASEELTFALEMSIRHENLLGHTCIKLLYEAIECSPNTFAECLREMPGSEDCEERDLTRAGDECWDEYRKLLESQPKNSWYNSGNVRE